MTATTNQLVATPNSRTIRTLTMETTSHITTRHTTLLSRTPTIIRTTTHPTTTPTTTPTTPLRTTRAHNITTAPKLTTIRASSIHSPITSLTPWT
jgi:hypothetical protein